MQIRLAKISIDKQDVKLKFDPSIFHRVSMSALSPSHSSRKIGSRISHSREWMIVREFYGA